MVTASAPTGSRRQLLCRSTSAIASGCSAYISRDRRPATGKARYALIRQVTLAGPKSRHPRVYRHTRRERSRRTLDKAGRGRVQIRRRRRVSQVTSSFAGIAAPDSVIGVIVRSSLGRLGRQS